MFLGKKIKFLDKEYGEKDLPYDVQFLSSPLDTDNPVIYKLEISNLICFLLELL